MKQKSDQKAISVAIASWQEGDFASTFAILEGIQGPQARHLRGLAARRLGKLDEAIDCLKDAGRKDPNNAEIYHNLALTEIDCGSYQDAYTSVSKALSLEPKWPVACRTKARILLAQERWAEAQAVYEQLLEKNSDDVVARYGCANAWLEQGKVELARDEFDRLIDEGMTDPACRFMRARSLQVLGLADKARIDFISALEQKPSVLFLRETARHLWTMNEHDEFQHILTQPYADESLQLCAAELLRQSGAHAQVIEVLSALDDSADAFATLAWSELDQTKMNGALALAESALELNGDHSRARAAAITALCGMGRSAEAQVHVDHMRAREPLGQHWVAYQLMIWRLIDDPRYYEWVNYDVLIQNYELSVPDGYASLAEFNAALSEALISLHNHRCHPLDQSLRGGSQTRRDLELESDPVIVAYLDALDEPIRKYLQHIGNQADHPLSARNSGSYRFSGCWSVQLKRGGHHVNHVHPEGWISSAYYVQVPDLDASTRSGWIQFGEPPYPTTPASPPEYSIEPKAGRLVLFPSYVWHGTIPTIGDELRVTAPFDLMPT